MPTGYKLTQSQFLAKAVAVHGSRYDYSRAVYQGKKVNITIICPEHGPFEQRPESHIEQKAGCPICRKRGPSRKTQQKFITQAQAKHGSRYDYSRVKYEGGTEKIEIICSAHGIFLQAPSEHLQGKGCIRCSGLNRLTATEFIKKAQVTHGDNYDYSRVTYKNNKAKVEITCSKHGVFKQTPDSHIRGSGCRKCRSDKMSQSQRWTVETFVTAAQAKHGVGTYDYSQVAYRGSSEKVEIICPAHGVFKQSSHSHLAGRGCSLCWEARRGDATRADTALFIEKAQAKHGVGTYDYSQVAYTVSTKRVIIICPAHGTFQQVPAYHLFGDGCPRCGVVRRANTQRDSVERFIEKAQAKHGIGAYDYSQVVCVAGSKKVVIGCLKHGAFKQTRSDHLCGKGCPTCALEQRAATDQFNWAGRADGRTARLYLVRLFNATENFYKVGVTFHSIEKRFSRSNLPNYQYEILSVHKSDNPNRVFEWEQSILETFSHLRYTPILNFVGATECFSSADEILSIFPL